LHPLELSPDDVFGFTKLDRAACRALVSELRWDGIYTPPGLDRAVLMPHTSGGMNWGGVAIDPTQGLLIVNQTHVGMIMQLVRREELEGVDLSAIAYPEEFYPMTGTPYAVKRSPLFSPLGAPCNPPPWGTLTAVDLRSGDVRWRIPFGSTREMAPAPLWIEMGTPNFGGGMATAGGLYFIGATLDQYFHAYDSATGDLLWSHRMPHPGNAVPMTFRLRPDAKQYVVMASGGNPLGSMGDALIAYRLRD
jgi:quinoprotein glucose dehydrogenase